VEVMNRISAAPRVVASASADVPVDRWAWLRWATAVLAADLIIHNGVGVWVNDWQGWGVVAGAAVFVLISGLVIVGLTFGLLVRWGLKPSTRGRNRAAPTALAAGIASLLAYGLYPVWAPMLVAPAALVLARAGLRAANQRGGRGFALAGAVLGLTSLALWTLMVIVVLVTENYPFGL
jgi:hypothetical protein